ncbi:adenylate/guanylate cyclase domain-containing protein [Robiginitalea sediminis]|uniref:adenylate/guanylate cyclase domain-containing protein n=1 Tax=Robiginitalea sediminis TaxID=1982593 RepID=UPI000B4A59DD|nr:adenylate/guanylate cyclase domain-containing protein [Robiginitalea sediminis]
MGKASTTRIRYRLRRILPFGVIWLVIGWYTLISDALATGYQNVRPDTDITMSPGIFAFASLAVFTVGLVMGTLEVLWLSRRFQGYSFLGKVTVKMGIYLLFMLAVIGITYPLAAGLEAGSSPLSAAVMDKFGHYLQSTTFLSTLLSLSFSILASLLYAGIAEHLGHSVLLNFFTGRYHKPKEEERIFMFLDLKSSTSVAEKLGHKRYYQFLKAYYARLSDAIIAHRGEVYQYIGDEIVITWQLEQGLENARCLRCFFAMQDALSRSREQFESEYGQCPEFRAGLHMGPVTTGEIGALKKEIFFTGDVLNVTSRIQKSCKEYGTDLIASGTLLDHLGNDLPAHAEPLGTIPLEGRTQPVALFAITPLPPG